MKKIWICILTLSMVLGILGGCGKQENQSLPVPDYPLDADIIAEALQE